MTTLMKCLRCHLPFPDVQLLYKREEGWWATTCGRCGQEQWVRLEEANPERSEGAAGVG